ncbi:MAG: hypothetical protein IPG89_06515 [Bacteroidetes bacterium]|nr:hypothetical protein [Bacteroidota bacterium]
MSAIYSVYKTKFRNDCVEIKPKKWKSLIGPIDKFKRPKPFRIYCYLKNNSALVLMFSEKQLDMDDTLINMGDWFVLELIKD